MEEVVRRNTLSLPPQLVYGRLTPVKEDVGLDIIDKTSHSEVFPDDRTKDEPPYGSEIMQAASNLFRHYTECVDYLGATWIR